jgi:hypothetical protein
MADALLIRKLIVAAWKAAALMRIWGKHSLAAIIELVAKHTLGCNRSRLPRTQTMLAVVRYSEVAIFLCIEGRWWIPVLRSALFLAQGGR